MNQPPIEPNAEMRILAHSLRQMYLALTQEGFTQREALSIISEVIRANGPSA